MATTSSLPFAASPHFPMNKSVVITPDFNNSIILSQQLKPEPSHMRLPSSNTITQMSNSSYFSVTHKHRHHLSVWIVSPLSLGKVFGSFHCNWIKIQTLMSFNDLTVMCHDHFSKSSIIFPVMKICQLTERSLSFPQKYNLTYCFHLKEFALIFLLPRMYFSHNLHGSLFLLI